MKNNPIELNNQMNEKKKKCVNEFKCQDVDYAGMECVINGVRMYQECKEC